MNALGPEGPDDEALDDEARASSQRTGGYARDVALREEMRALRRGLQQTATQASLDVQLNHHRQEMSRNLRRSVVLGLAMLTVAVMALLALVTFSRFTTADLNKELATFRTQVHQVCLQRNASLRAERALYGRLLQVQQGAPASAATEANIAAYTQALDAMPPPPACNYDPDSPQDPGGVVEPS